MTEYKNRIVGTGEEALDQIQFNPRNWRIHPYRQQDDVKGVLEEIGFVKQVIINQRTGNLIDGHLRCQLAARAGMKTIPVIYVDLSEEEELIALASLDQTGLSAITDRQKLDELLLDIETGNQQVKTMLSDIARRETLDTYNYQFKPAIEPQVGAISHTSEEVDKAKDKLDNKFKDNKQYVEVICPFCAEQFYLDKEDVK